MTSETSFIKFVREDIRHRGWYAALSSIVLFLLMPVYAVLFLDSQRSFTYDADLEQYIQDTFPGLICGSTFFPLCAAIFVLAMVSAMSGYAFVHEKEQLDFYHSLPLRRGRWFGISWTGGLIMFALPYTVCSGLTISAGLISGTCSTDIIPPCILAWAGGLLGYLIVYHTGILAVMLTGRIVTELFAFLVLSVYPYLTLTLVSELKEIFYVTYCEDARNISVTLAEYLSPGFLYENLVQVFADPDALLGPDLIGAALAVSLFLLACSYVLYRIYPSESAGNALAFPRTEPAAKVLISVPAAIWFSIYTQYFTGVTGVRWIVIISLLSVILLNGIIEFIYTQDIRMLAKDGLWSLISVVCTAAILCIFGFDLTGYDTWLPGRNRIEAVYLLPDSFDYNFSYPESYDQLEEKRAEGFSEDPEGIEAVLHLAQSGIDNLSLGVNPDTLYELEEILYEETGSQTYEYAGIRFSYRLTNGKTVSRRYAVNKDQAMEALGILFQDPAYRENILPVFHVDTDSIRTIHLADIYGDPEPMRLDQTQKEALLECYRQDSHEVSVHDLDQSEILGEFYFSLPDSLFNENSDAALYWISEVETYSLSGFYIYPSYTRTLEWLNANGYTLNSSIDPDSVRSIYFYISSADYSSGKFDEMLSRLSESYTGEELTEGIYLTNHEDIQAVLEHVRWNTGGFLTEYTYTSWADIEYNSGYGSNGYRLE